MQSIKCWTKFRFINTLTIKHQNGTKVFRAKILTQNIIKRQILTDSIVDKFASPNKEPGYEVGFYQVFYVARNSANFWSTWFTHAGMVFYSHLSSSTTFSFSRVVYVV